MVFCKANCSLKDGFRDRWVKLGNMKLYKYIVVFIFDLLEPVYNKENKQTKDCNCRKKEEWSLEGKCRSEDIIYKCVFTATGHPRKVYSGTAEGDFKQRYYTKSHLKIQNMQMRHHYQNTSGK